MIEQPQCSHMLVEYRTQSYQLSVEDAREMAARHPADSIYAPPIAGMTMWRGYWACSDCDTRFVPERSVAPRETQGAGKPSKREYGVRRCRGHWHITHRGEDIIVDGDPFASCDAALDVANLLNRNASALHDPKHIERSCPLSRAPLAIATRTLSQIADAVGFEGGTVDDYAALVDAVRASLAVPRSEIPETSEPTDTELLAIVRSNDSTIGAAIDALEELRLRRDGALSVDEAIAEIKRENEFISEQGVRLVRGNLAYAKRLRELGVDPLEVLAEANAPDLHALVNLLAPRPEGQSETGSD